MSSIGAPGQPHVLSVRPSFGEPFVQLPYDVTVRYDLRPVVAFRRGPSARAFLAALDLEKLRRRGASIGLDAASASEHPLARKCLCSAGGRLKPLCSWESPGELRLALSPACAPDESEASVLFRVVTFASARSAIDPEDPMDWCAFGAPIVLRLRLSPEGSRQTRRAAGGGFGGFRLPALSSQRLGGDDGSGVEAAYPPCSPSLNLVSVAPTSPSLSCSFSPSPPPLLAETEEDQEGEFKALEAEEAPDARLPEYHGIDLRQLFSFHEEIREDIVRYTGVHRLQGRCHVCIHQPCPFRPVEKAKYDDHRGARVRPLSSLSACDAWASAESAMGQDPKSWSVELTSGGAAVEPLLPTTGLVVQRYVRPRTQGTGASFAALLNGGAPRLARIFVTHSWREPFAELLNTLQLAVGFQEPFFLNGFSLDQHGAHTDALRALSLRALGRARRIAVAVDRDLGAFKRPWCLMELAKARELRRPTTLWPNPGVDPHGMEELALGASLGEATAWHEGDGEGNGEDDDCGGGDGVSRRRASWKEAAEDALRPPELREAVFHSKWEIERLSSPDAPEMHLRLFLWSRVHGYRAALRQLSSLKEFSPETLRRLQAEHERKSATQLVFLEHRLRATMMERELDGLRRHISDMDAAEAAESARVKAEIEEINRQGGTNRANALMKLREQIQEVEAKLVTVRSELAEASARSARLDEELGIEEAALAEERAAVKALVDAWQQSQDNRLQAGRRMAVARASEIHYDGLEKETRAKFEGLQRDAIEAERCADEAEARAEAAALELEEVRHQLEEAKRLSKEEEDETDEDFEAVQVVRHKGTVPLPVTAEGDEEDAEPKMGAAASEPVRTKSECSSASASSITNGISARVGGLANKLFKSPWSKDKGADTPDRSRSPSPASPSSRSAAFKWG